MISKENPKDEEAGRQKKEFFRMLCHELRTPLAIMNESINLVLDQIPGKINEDQTRILSIAKSNAGKLAQMIDDLASGKFVGKK